MRAQVYSQPAPGGLIYRDEIAAWCNDRNIPMVFEDLLERDPFAFQGPLEIEREEDTLP